VNIFNRQTDKAISYDEFRQQFDDEVLETADLRPSVGRPKKVLLGERRQITRSIGVHIAALLVEKLNADRFVIAPGPSGISLYDDHQRGQWAKNRIGQLASVNREATDSDPFALIEKVCGRLLWINKVKSPAGRPEGIYINRDSACPAELRIWIDRVEKRAQRENQLGHKASADVSAILRYLDADQTLRDAKAAYYASIRDGVPRG